MTSILPEIFDPPRMATNGCPGRSSAPCRYASSRSMSSPATAGVRWCATPSVDAWARCAAPKASFTYRSPSCASPRASRGSLVSSPPRKRVFSSNTICPSVSAIVAFCASSVSVLSTKETSRLGISSLRRRETGSSEYLASGLPFGRPRCDSTTMRAPRSASSSSVGIAARMRVSSVMWPCSSRGTLKSTRTSARFPRSCSAERSRTVSFAIAYSRAPTYCSRSTHRDAYPHSLSYQPETFTSSPSTTFVHLLSRMQECGFPM